MRGREVCWEDWELQELPVWPPPSNYNNYNRRNISGKVHPAITQSELTFDSPVQASPGQGTKSENVRRGCQAGRTQIVTTNHRVLRLS